MRARPDCGSSCRPVARTPVARGVHGGGLTLPAARGNPHRSAAREAALFNPTLDRARATPTAPLSTARLRAVFHPLQTRRSAKR
jgi:hypothetical protein